MKPSCLEGRRVLIMAAMLAVAWCAPQARAQWSSLRANNRSPQQARTEVRTAPATPRARSAEPARGLETRSETGRTEVRRGEDFREQPRGHVEVRPREGFERGGAERGHWDLEADRRNSYFWFGYNPGMILNTLPPDYSQIYVGGNPYYYNQGVYYQPGASGYVVVSPPIGAVVPSLPPGAEAVGIGNTAYYYAAGAFYLPQPEGFLVVAPPLGATVSTLPAGATPVTINGMLYYQAEGSYFLPVMQNGVTAYTVVQP